MNLLFDTLAHMSSGQKGVSKLYCHWRLPSRVVSCFSFLLGVISLVVQTRLVTLLFPPVLELVDNRTLKVLVRKGVGVRAPSGGYVGEIIYSHNHPTRPI